MLLKLNGRCLSTHRRVCVVGVCVGGAKFRDDCMPYWAPTLSLSLSPRFPESTFPLLLVVPGLELLMSLRICFLAFLDWFSEVMARRSERVTVTVSSSSPFLFVARFRFRFRFLPPSLPPLLEVSKAEKDNVCPLCFEAWLPGLLACLWGQSFCQWSRWTSCPRSSPFFAQILQNDVPGWNMPLSLGLRPSFRAALILVLKLVSLA